jgi:hypothetical protein
VGFAFEGFCQGSNWEVLYIWAPSYLPRIHCIAPLPMPSDTQMAFIHSFILQIFTEYLLPVRRDSRNCFHMNQICLCGAYILIRGWECRTDRKQISKCLVYWAAESAREKHSTVRVIRNKGLQWFFKVVRSGFSVVKKTADECEGMSHFIKWGKSIPGSRNSLCKSQEVGGC